MHWPDAFHSRLWFRYTTATPKSIPGVFVLCIDAWIEVPNGEVCEICGQEPESSKRVMAQGLDGLLAEYVSS